MKYPAISIEELERLTTERLAGTSADVENSIKWIGTDPEVDLTDLEETAQAVRDALASFRTSKDANKRDLFEGQVAAMLHQALHDVDLAVLDDPGFWRYVGAVHLWEFATWRQEAAFVKDWAAYRKYIDGTNHAECVALRVFLRGRIAELNGDYSLSTAVEQATDLWRSHILRVKISYSSTLSQELIRQVAEHKIATDSLRKLAKDITRRQSNLVLPLYDGQEVEDLIDELRTAQQPGDRT